MANPSVPQGDLIVYGTLSASTLDVPAGTLVDADVASNAAIGAAKIIHQFPIEYHQNSGADVAAATALLHVAKAAGTIVAVKVGPDTAPTGGDKAFTVDVKKSTAGGA